MRSKSEMEFLQLDDDILQYICEKSNPREIIRLAFTCRSLHQLLTGNSLWEKICIRGGLVSPGSRLEDLGGKSWLDVYATLFLFFIVSYSVTVLC